MEQALEQIQCLFSIPREYESIRWQLTVREVDSGRTTYSMEQVKGPSENLLWMRALYMRYCG